MRLDESRVARASGSSIPGGATYFFSDCFTRGRRELCSSLFLVYREGDEDRSSVAAMGVGARSVLFKYGCLQRKGA